MFDVQIGEKTVIEDLDIFAAAGGKDRTLVRTIDNVTAEKLLEIKFVPKQGASVISGVEIVAQSPATGE